jgi:nitrite reductase/ring-hydroxylating ferredoxin subunit
MSSFTEGEVPGVTEAESAVVPAATDESRKWSKVSEISLPVEGDRLHAKVDGRYITIFRHGGKLSCIDAICHHAGGPLTLGPLKDIEDLNLTVVLCPWHKFMVSIDGGLKAYQGVTFVDGKPVNTGWKVGKVVQRPHYVVERESGVYVVSPMSPTDPLTH